MRNEEFRIFRPTPTERRGGGVWRRVETEAPHGWPDGNSKLKTQNLILRSDVVSNQRVRQAMRPTTRSRHLVAVDE